MAAPDPAPTPTPIERQVAEATPTLSPVTRSPTDLPVQSSKAEFLKAVTDGEYADVGGPKAIAPAEERIVVESATNVLHNDYHIPAFAPYPNCLAEFQANVRESLRVATEHVTGKNFSQNDYALAKAKLSKGWRMVRRRRIRPTALQSCPAEFDGRVRGGTATFCFGPIAAKDVSPRT